MKKLIRLALACEYQRRPIRRAEISEKVLGAQQGRQFKSVFEDAQTQLRSVFGMEMVELPAREKVTVREKRSQKDGGAGAAVKSAASWVLTSILPSEFHDPEILPPTAAPTASEEATYTSLYTVLISLISLSGGSLPEAKLDRYLRRLGMEDNTPVTGYGKTEQLLKRMEREGYLLKVKESVGAGEEDISWHVGPRGKVEVGRNGVRGLADAVYGYFEDGGEEAELQRRLTRTLAWMDEDEERARASGEKQKLAEARAASGKKRGRPRKKDVEAEEDEEDDDDE